MFLSSGLFDLVFGFIFIFVIGTFVFNAFTGLRQWNTNNNSPRLTVNATVSSKRTNVTRHNHPNGGDHTGAHGYHTTTSTTYYVTFQVESGDRMELHVNGTEYGMLVEGDFGQLSFQGTRYLGFYRTY